MYFIVKIIKYPFLVREFYMLGFSFLSYLLLIVAFTLPYWKIVSRALVCCQIPEASPLHSFWDNQPFPSSLPLSNWEGEGKHISFCPGKGNRLI